MNSDASLISLRYKAHASLLLLCALHFSGQAQVDTTAAGSEPPVEVIMRAGDGTITGTIEPTIKDPIVKYHSPRKASIMSAALPGLGQVYNKKYWKVPIIYGGFAVAGYFLSDNLQNIRRYKNAYIAEIDGDPSTINDTGFNTRQLDLLIDQYTQWRDLSYIAFAIIYILNIVDASVDAHLFYFDVSDDLSLNIKPSWAPHLMQPPGITLTLKL